MACEACGRARKKLLAGYPGAAAAEAARILWWKARRGIKDEPPPIEETAEPDNG